MVSKQYKLRAQNYTEEVIPEAVLDENDPIQELKRLAGVGNSASLTEYTGYGSINKTEISNASITANEKIQYQNQNNVQPGSPEWFRLWFAKTGITGETPW